MAKLTREQVVQIVRKAREKGEKPDLSGADLSWADLSWVDLNGANLGEADLREAILSGANLSWADLDKANLSGVDLIEASLTEASLGWTNLIEADLNEADLTKVDFSWADLRGANLSGANLSEADLIWADLSGANLSGANLSEVDLSKANLSKANLSEANLSKAFLGEANLSKANLSEANLSKAFLGEANLSEAVFLSTIFVDVDLSRVKGLETVNHRGPSYIDFHTIQRSQSKIPDVFLRGCGVPETFITYMPSLTGKAIEYYSCFISYSSEDQAFAERLHADLQSKGVRCWFAPEDMKIGAKIRHSIDQAIRIHDKLLLVLSEQSVASQWVEHEVEHALDLEIERGELVLFPIRLDQAIMRSRTGWAGNIKRGRHIGNFTSWKEHDAYQRAFERLLRDLKTEEPLPLPPHLAPESAKHKRKESLQIQLARHYSNLNKLREQAAIYEAGATPLHLLNQIEDEEKQIADVEAELEAMRGE